MKNLILTLLCIPNIGKNTVNQFLETIDQLPKDELDIKNILIEIKNINKRIKVPSIEEINIAKEKANKIMLESNKLNIKKIDRLDNNFPQLLKNIKNPPQILFYKGNHNLLNSINNITVIGSRRASEYGLNKSYEVSYNISSKGYNIVSGLARGCDEKAHKGCLDANKNTISVLAGGLDKIYPLENTQLVEDILNKNGCIVSEYPIGYQYFKNNFIERDRIQSGLSVGVLVVETSLKSGTMHTVKFCKEQGRVLGCLDIKSEGNENIINTNNVIKVSSNEDLSKFIYEVETLKDRIIISKEQSENRIQMKFDI